ncbi:MAG: ribosome biogenesis GTPase Der [bacterium]|nr:ribosome biogenesis GTPase Der [bacterium]
MSRVQAVASGLPVVAIVGRPNVGKSTLFNRLVRARRAIVDDAPGVTRDRVVAAAEWAGRRFLCVDTGGFEADAPRDPAALDAQVRTQALAAVLEADCVVCVLDAVAGLTPGDRDTVRLLQRAGRPVRFVANKVDGPGRDALVADFYAAGIETVFPVSAAHGRGIDELLDAVVGAFPPSVSPTPAVGEGTRLALMGRPNVGKSSLLNRLLGQARAVVSPIAGTTRDAVDTPVSVDGRPYVLIDTAGIRRRGRVDDPLERHGAVRALGTFERTDLVLLVLDATDGMTDQDARLAGRALEAGRGIVLLANKWDLLPPPERSREAFRKHLVALHPAFASLPLLPVSAVSGDGLGKLWTLVRQVEDGYRAVVGTPVLNRVLRAAVESVAPPSPGGRPLRLFYATQTSTAPPAVTVFASAPAKVPAAYVRYLQARFAEAFGVVGVPLTVTLRARREERATAPPRAGRRRPVAAVPRRAHAAGQGAAEGPAPGATKPRTRGTPREPGKEARSGPRHAPGKGPRAKGPKRKGPKHGSTKASAKSPRTPRGRKPGGGRSSASRGGGKAGGRTRGRGR